MRVRLVEDVNSNQAVLSPQLEATVLKARVHAHHAVQVISNMLDYTKLKEGKLVLPTAVPFALHGPGNLLSECITLVQHLVDNKQVELRVES